MELKTNNVIYEYENRIELDGLSAKYIVIPLPLILDNEIDKRRVVAFAYLKSYCGINNEINFTIPDMVTWCGNKPDRRTNGANDKFLDIIDALCDRGYFTYLTDISKSSLMKLKFNQDMFDEECSFNRFAILYLDEISKIMNYNESKNKTNNVTNSNILLVFAYLRAMIYHRPNRIKLSSGMSIEKRKELYPEAYNENYKSICNELDISQKTFTRIINVLENELNLISVGKPHILIDDKQYKTPDSIFVNTYKREDKYLLASGSDYIDGEINAKEKNMKKHLKDYKINQNKKGGDGK
ncbi:MAG: hypothetical protein ACI4VL_02290 [Bacilli bacterium]